MSSLNPNQYLRARVETYSVQGNVTEKKLVILDENNREILNLAIAHFSQVKNILDQPNIKKKLYRNFLW